MLVAGAWPENMVGDRAQRENVEFLGVKRHPGNGFWRHVEQTLWIAEPPGASCPQLWDEWNCRRPFALCRLPVEYFHGDVHGGFYGGYRGLSGAITKMVGG